MPAFKDFNTTSWEFVAQAMSWNKALSAGLALVAAIGAQAAPQRPDSQDWKRFVRGPSSTTVKPARILSHNTTGNVHNADGLISGHGPTVLTRNGDDDEAPSIVVDFGENNVGVLNIHFAGSHSTSTGLPGLQLAFSETQQFLTNISDFTRSDNASGAQKLTNGTDQVAVKNERYTWQDLHGCQNGTQVCSDGLHGFRYVRITLSALAQDAPYTSNSGSVSISSLSLDWSAYLGTPDTYTGWFTCSDDDLTQWWFDGVHTTDMDTWVFLGNETEPRDADSPTLDGKQVIFDGAKRDRDPYVGDLGVSALTSYLSHDFSEAARNVLEDLALHQNADGWIPPASINNYTLALFDYPLWWVVCSVDLVWYTGNMTYAQAYFPVMQKALDQYYPSFTNNQTHLLNKTAASGLGDYAFLPRSESITYYNALYVYALNRASSLASTLGNSGAASNWSSRASTVSTALIDRNFDASVGAFYDGGPCPNAAPGTICDVHAQDGNGIAVLAGITNQSLSTDVLNYWEKATSLPYGNAFYDSDIMSPGSQFSQRVYAFISYGELAARFATPGAAASGFDELRRLYGWMASHDPLVTQWEGIGPGGSPYEGAFTSMAHGWSTAVVPVLSNYVLGVTPQGPGFSKWQVCPVVDGGGLTWAKGVVPTPHGGLSVSWEKESTRHGTTFSLKITAPKGTQGSVCVPTTGFAGENVKLNGKAVSGHAAKEAGPGSMMLEVGSGAHVITVGV